MSALAKSVTVKTDIRGLPLKIAQQDLRLPHIDQFGSSSDEQVYRFDVTQRILDRQQVNNKAVASPHNV